LRPHDLRAQAHVCIGAASAPEHEADCEPDGDHGEQPATAGQANACATLVAGQRSLHRIGGADIAHEFDADIAAFEDQCLSFEAARKSSRTAAGWFPEATPIRFALNHAARISVMSSPWNACLPVSNSYSTQPNATGPSLIYRLAALLGSCTPPCPGSSFHCGRLLRVASSTDRSRALRRERFANRSPHLYFAFLVTFSCGLQIAMNDSFLVCGFERFRNLLCDGKSFLDRNRSFPLDVLRQRLAGDSSMTR